MPTRVRPYLYYDIAVSICTTCYRRIDAKIVFEDGNVFMLKRCPQHGFERVLISDDIDYYRRCREVFIAWDDWGGFYDHVPPPHTDDMGLGFRVPVIVVGPYVRRGYVSHVTHESSGFLRYTEEVFDLPTLGTRDATADDFRDCFDYTQPPTPFVPIPTAHTAAFFLQ